MANLTHQAYRRDLAMILLIDSYDSFSNNLASLVEQHSGQQVVTIRNDSYLRDEYEDFVAKVLPSFEYVVIGPGPGHPENEADVGIIGWLFEKFKSEPQATTIPILGICLGFQSMCYAFGGKVVRLADAKHGQIYSMKLSQPSELFALAPSQYAFESVRYHSLYVTSPSSEIEQLAYCEESQDFEATERIMMAAKHKTLPFYGVQYHPESICSQRGDELVKNFTQIASKHNLMHRPQSIGASVSNEMLRDHAVQKPYLIANGTFKSNHYNHIYIQGIDLPPSHTAANVCEYLRRNDMDFILLNSAATPARWSILGLPIEGQSVVLTHSTDEPQVYHEHANKRSKTTTFKISPEETIWNVLANKMKDVYISKEDLVCASGTTAAQTLPFYGGFIGFVSYEEGQHINLGKLGPICSDGNPTPDMKFVFVERSIVYDHVDKKWFVVSINQQNDDKIWITEFCTRLTEAGTSGELEIGDVPASVSDLCCDEDSIQYDFPSKETYRTQFEACQEFLHAGDSYELCLTTQLKIALPKYIDAWDVYKILTLHKNPAPFSCFMEFDDCALISSSPERFLSCKESAEKGRMIELRPIKGTVKNTAEIGLKEATEILKTPKEIGENLMIVDLIRHDLYQFCERVDVPQLMKVEEYKTVFQLVSVIQGLLPDQGYHGIDVLQSSLPPGSMTGAPKKRSVEILQDIESLQANAIKGGRRGIYSGVAGYWSVTDESDWSVIIRSTYHYNKDRENSADTNMWRIGAGGAITVMSTLEGEWEEMHLKLTSALQAFLQSNTHTATL